MIPKTNKVGLLAFSIAFFLLCIAPFAGMAFTSDQVSSDEDSLTTMPVLILSDGSPNLTFLNDAGSYFEDHFAFRNEAIDLNAHLRVGLFATSPTDQVIIGDEGWLYYGGTLANYQGVDPLTERELVNISHNLELMQGYVEAQGAAFVLMIAPNKNSLYPEYMPYYYLEGDDDSRERLMQALDEKNINYVDLFALFNEQSDELYYKTDTHWNNEGAFLAGNSLLVHANKDELEVRGDPEAETIIGDIERMLYPITAGEEESFTLETGAWAFLGDATSVKDSSIDTTGEGEGTLLMFRDSFADALIPLISPAFDQAHYTSLIPYNLTQAKTLEADIVVIERAERHIDLLGEDAPFMLAPSASLEKVKEEESIAHTETVLNWHQDGDFRVIEGWVDESLMTNESKIYIEVEGPAMEKRVLVPFYVSCAKENTEGTAQEGETQEQTLFGFKLYLDELSLTDGSYTFRVLVSNENTSTTQAVLTQELQR